MPDPKQTDLAKTIGQAWDLARAQLSELRAQVEQTARMAQAQTKSNALGGERDVALRNLGEAVWRLVRAGKLELPSAVSGSVRALEQVERKLEAHASEISDILREGEEAVERLRASRKREKGRIR